MQGHVYSSRAIKATSHLAVSAASMTRATGIGALGLLGWCRKRKNAAALAA